MNITELKKLLALVGISPQKRFSQNFLYDNHILEKIVRHIPRKAPFYVDFTAIYIYINL